MAARVDVYGGMSQYAVKVLNHNFGRDGIVTPGGVNLEEMVPADARSDTPALLFSGAITEPRKGVATILDALPLIAESEPLAEPLTDMEAYIARAFRPSKLSAD